MYAKLAYSDTLCAPHARTHNARTHTYGHGYTYIHMRMTTYTSKPDNYLQNAVQQPVQHTRTLEIAAHTPIHTLLSNITYEHIHI